MEERIIHGLLVMESTNGRVAIVRGVVVRLEGVLDCWKDSRVKGRR